VVSVIGVRLSLLSSEIGARKYAAAAGPPKASRASPSGGGELHAAQRSEKPGGHYFAVGITNSAPLPMLSGHRCMIDFCLV